jgi:uncharacterized protein (DUF427 family)
MKTPGPDHPITMARNPNKIRVTLGGQVIAETTRALTMKEAAYPPVHYIPRADVRMERFERSQHSSHCPYKGEAAYYSIEAAGRKAANAVWTYERPFPAVAQIEALLAFYPDRVDAIEELPLTPAEAARTSGVS